jgi:peptidase E
VTKYILAGGNDRGVAAYPVILKEELPDNLSDLCLLSCFFSIEENEWSAKAKDWKSWFFQNLGISHYTVADFDNFEVEIRKADIVYFHGGHSWLLLESLSKYKDLEQMLEDKVVIGSSAGANVLANNFWSSTFKKAGKGLAMVDVNIMVHYGVKEINRVIRTDKDWTTEEHEFSQLIRSSEILHLPEGTIKVFSKA